MFDRSRTPIGLGTRDHAAERPVRTRRMRVEDLEGRALLATLLPIPSVPVPQYLGYQVPLEGGSGSAQTYTVTSSNPVIKATIAQGNFLTFDVKHDSSGATDPAFVGKLTFQLFQDLTPKTVAKIEQLVTQGFYTGTNFFRIANLFPGTSDFIVQGGAVNAQGQVNQPGFPFNDEFNQQLSFTGIKLAPDDPNTIYSVAGQLAMANSGPNTNGSQFFVTTGSPRFLDFKHTVFAQLVEGQQTLQKMIGVARNGETPVSPIVVQKAELSNTNPDGVVHIDATGAASGQSATITVTATNPADSTTATQSFQVVVTPNATQQRSFLVQPVPNQIVGLTKSTTPVQGQTAVFQIPFVNPNAPGSKTAFTVQGGITNGAFTAVQNATASVDGNGIVTVKPNSGFSGVINLLVGVRNPNDPDTPGSYDYQTLTLTVAQSAELNLAPIAVPGTVNAVVNTPVTVTLNGNTANPASQQTLTYTIVSPPANGSISNFDSAKGTFTYVPNPGFQGTDTLSFRVRDSGSPTPNLDSTNATETIIVGGGQTGAVRLIGKVLVVTPPPRVDTVPNTILITLRDGQIQTFVNGRLDAIQPKPADLDRIVVFGAKAGDQITVDPTVTVPATLDGGHGGQNTILVGGGATTVHAWFGTNTITAGPGNDYIVGKSGRFKVKGASATDLVFAGMPHRPATFHNRGWKPGGTFFRFKNGRLQPIATPKPPGFAKFSQTFLPPATT